MKENSKTFLLLEIDGDRMSTFFEATDSAKARSALTSRRIKEGSW